MRSAFISLALLAFATPAAADRFSLSYDASGLGLVPLGEMTIDALVTEEDYRVSATLNSGGLMNLFERTSIRVSSSGLINAGDVRWRRYDLDHRYSRKHRVIAMTNSGGGIDAEIRPNYRLWGEPPATSDQRNRSRDPLSTMVAMAVDVGQSRRCSGSYPTFDGRFHYVIGDQLGRLGHPHAARPRQPGAGRAGRRRGRGRLPSCAHGSIRIIR